MPAELQLHYEDYLALFLLISLPITLCVSFLWNLWHDWRTRIRPAKGQVWIDREGRLFRIVAVRKGYVYMLTDKGNRKVPIDSWQVVVQSKGLHLGARRG